MRKVSSQPPFAPFAPLCATLDHLPAADALLFDACGAEPSNFAAGLTEVGDVGGQLLGLGGPLRCGGGIEYGLCVDTGHGDSPISMRASSRCARAFR